MAMFKNQRVLYSIIQSWQKQLVHCPIDRTQQQYMGMGQYL